MYASRVIRQGAASAARRLIVTQASSAVFAHRATIAIRPFSVLTKSVSQPSSIYSRRSYSVLSEEPEAVTYKYDGIKNLASNPEAHPNTVLVDVREPVEFNDGHIPNAINIPFTSSPGALSLDPEDFSEQFGFEKPSTDKELVFYCLAGVRSSAAEDLARTFGYKNRGNYLGSYEDWVTHENARK
ncbi:thiosulfate sulfurtransferase Rdl2p, mitochondrial [[Candida] anglica]|uniref:Thiosulfate sulfurtransferase Rdl2p, mitochondrial n=1 Tax=[Candida] anglica TaxID=148631 RepID=A0ABP0ENE5_9ASCO